MEEKAGGGVKWWIKVLVLFHMFAITFWSLPDPPDRLKIWSDNPDSPLLSKARPPTGTQWVLVKNRQWFKRSNLHYYLTSTGFWQYWDMFAPNPSNIDVWVDAEIDYEDGTSGIRRYPRMYDLSIPEKYLKERYRKFLERAHLEENRWLWPTFAQRMALEAFEATGKMPREVRLRRHWRRIPDPARRAELQEDYNVFIYYTHIVDQPKLREQAR